MKLFSAFLTVLCCAVCSPVFSQNFTISYETPDSLVVCATDTLTVKVTNNTGQAITGALLDLELDSGLEYVPGTVAGATESSISNLAEPVLALPLLPPGVPVTVRVQIAATCGLVEAINSGELFSALLRVRNGAQAEQLTTSTFIVETGLVVITQVDNDSMAGQKGDMLFRTLHVQNTRLGVIRHLTLRDLHPEGISIQTAGAVAQDDQPTAFNARFDGSFFANFGDGDDLLEFNETVLIVEKITVTDCALPTGFEVGSDLTAAWACTADAPACQGDSARAEVTILPFTKLPKLVFKPIYGYPFDRCALAPAAQRIHVVNQGESAANNVLVQLSSPFNQHLGIDGTSFRLKINGVETPIAPNLEVPNSMSTCNILPDSMVIIVIPTVPALDSLEILFDTYFCGEECDAPNWPINGTFFHLVECPEGGSMADTFVMAPSDDRARWTSEVQFSIGECVEDGQVYNFNYFITSGRLLDDQGIAWLQLDLPWGVFWQNSCQPLAGGQSPVSMTLDTLVTYDTITRVRLSYALPLPNDSLYVPFCLRVTCPDDATYTPLSNSPAPGPNGDFTIYNTLCSKCGYLGEGKFILTQSLDDDPGCGISSCSQFTLRTNCPCPEDTLPPNSGGIGGACGQCGTGLVITGNQYDAYRLNLGLPDHDNNRSADGGSVDLNKIRRDRFLPGDTMHVVTKSAILLGDSICFLGQNFFTEVIRSDIPYGGANDAFTVSTARSFFADPTKFRSLGAHIRIFDASSDAVYECNIDTLQVFYKKLYGVVSLVNVQPVVKIDELVTMRQGVVLTTDDLVQVGCLPPCFSLNAGDSVEITVDYKLDFNYTPYNAIHQPPLINFEMSFAPAFIPDPDFYSYRRFDTLMFQYSGYRDTLTHNTFGIRPCENSQEVKPFYYAIRIARENLFPFEVRPLTRIIDYKFDIPKNLTALSATLKYLRLQENVPIPALQNVALPFTQDTTTVSLDFSQAYLNPLDEGYKLETGLVFAPSCEFRAPDTSYQSIGIDYEGCLHMPDTSYILLLNKIGFFSNQARDTITTDETVLDFPTADVGADILLTNLAPVAGPNYWIELVNPDGGLSDFELLQLPQNTPVAATNGVFQLGTLGILAQKQLRIKAQNNSCEPQRLWVIYGWDCQPHLVPGAPSCARDTLQLLIQPQLAELELDLLQFPTDAPLCDTSDYIVFEVFNADLGYAFDPFASVQLPSGMQLMAGSSQIAYPSGSAFLPLADPAVLPNNSYEWNLDAALPPVAAGGLPGVNVDPQNGIQIRFKVLAACGVVSNSQLVFGARAQQVCGTPTNFLRKASDPLTVEGLTPDYGVQIGISEPGGGGPFSCSEHREFLVNMQINGSPETGDSIYITLPPGFLIEPFSYVPGINAPAGPPQQSGATVWQLPLPVGLPPNSSLSFGFTLIMSSGPNCAGVALTVQTRQRSVAFCPSINSDCAVYVATGEVNYSLIPDFPNLALINPAVEIGPDGSVTYSAQMTNEGAKIVYAPVLWFVRDVDGDGLFSAVDTIVEVRNFPSLQPGETHSDSWGHIGQMLTDPCNLLAVVPGAEICACDDIVVPLSGGNYSHTAVTICLGQTAALGVPQQTGHVYQWSGAGGLPCLNCPNFNWTPTSAGNFDLTLFDQTSGCQVTHQFEVLVNVQPALLTPDTIICRGEPVLLHTTPATSWQWQGPGLSNPNAATQLVQPLQTTTYNVTITNSANCTAVADATVTVLASDSIDLGKIRTCEGSPVDIFGTMTDAPGLYCVTYPKSNGCDSTRCVLLEVTPNTTEALARCPGDTVQVFGQPVAAAGQYCQTFTSSLGCDSTHCVVVSDLSVPNLTPLDTILLISGSSVTLQGPDGFATYSWSPPVGLSCTDCQNPVATPPDSVTAYVLQVTTADGCPGEWIVYFRFAPPCDPAELKIPNAITPDHDGINDVFRPAPVEAGPVVRRLRVFDRWGNKVYDQTGPLAAWDGNIDGKPAPVDTYVWLLELDCQGELKPIYGEVTVLR